MRTSHKPTSRPHGSVRPQGRPILATALRSMLTFAYSTAEQLEEHAYLRRSAAMSQGETVEMNAGPASAVEPTGLDDSPVTQSSGVLGVAGPSYSAERHEGETMEIDASPASAGLNAGPSADPSRGHQGGVTRIRHSFTKDELVFDRGGHETSSTVDDGVKERRGGQTVGLSTTYGTKNLG